MIEKELIEGRGIMIEEFQGENVINITNALARCKKISFSENSGFSNKILCH